MTAIEQNNVTVTTAGTQIQITSTPTPIKSVVFIALTTNTGLIYLGESDVASTKGFPRSAGQSLVFEMDTEVLDLSKFWVNSAVNGEGVAYFAVLKHGA